MPVDIEQAVSGKIWEQFRELILARTGLFSGQDWRDNLIKAVPAAAELAEYNNLREYYRILEEAETSSDVWDELISTVTVGETYFFRNGSHFSALRNHILPDLIDRHGDDRRLRIWSAGCSTGEEPYSLAILLHEFLPDIDSWNITILATDINKRGLHRAREGLYGEWSFRLTDPVTLKRYFSRRGKRFELKPQVRKMVTFGYLNLVEDFYPSLPTNTNAMDLILCRNVSIYLPEALVREIADKLLGCLLPGSWLVVGSAETSADIYSRFITRNIDDAFFYQKTAESIPWQISPAPKPSVEHIPGHVRGIEPVSRWRPTMEKEPLPAQKSLPPRPQPDDLYQEGLALAKQGLQDEAIARFMTYLKRMPDSAPAYSQIARLHANAGRLDEALNCARRAIECDPILAEAYYTLALIQQEDGNPDQAVTLLKKSLYLDPEFALAHFSLSNLYQQTGRTTEAVRQRTLVMRLVSKMRPEDELPGSEGLTVARMQSMLRATM